VLNIAEALESLSPKFFVSCVEIVQNLSHEEQPRIALRTEIDEDILCAIKAFELYWFCYWVCDHQYIQPRDGKDFADLLFASVCGTKLERCSEYFSRYSNYGDDDLQPFIRHDIDLAKYITGEKGALVEAASLARITYGFVDTVHYLAARIFHDAKTAAKLEQAWLNSGMSE
jgi:hypothetical protein